MPYLGQLTYAAPTGGPAPGPAASTTAPSDCAPCGRAFDTPSSVSAALARLGGPVLLVDDQLDTGWTMTVAAMALRQAGAPAVLPLALASAA